MFTFIDKKKNLPKHFILILQMISNGTCTSRRMEHSIIVCRQVYIGDLKAVINYVTVYIVYCIIGYTQNW